MNKKKVDLQKNKFASSRSSKQKLKKSKRTESSKRWISRQINDPYVSEAQKRGYRSRSAFKLLQINEKFNLFKSGMVIIDLGCAPGGWLQVAKKFGPKSSKIVGIDLGTTFSAIAELDDLGNPEVLSDPESGNRITRSAVYFGKDKVIVGEKARDASITSPKKVVFEVKR